MACFVETGQKRNPERNGNVSASLVPNSPQLRILDVALAEDFSVRSLSARAALYARPWPKMASEACAQRWACELDPEEKSTGVEPMTITEYAATTARAFMAAEIAMASAIAELR